MSNIIEITNGSVVLKSFVDRKTAREYSAILYEGLDAASKEIKIPLANLDRASDVLVLGLIEGVTIGESRQEVSQDLIDKLDSDDFKKLETACLSIMNNEEKKSGKLRIRPGGTSKEVKA